MPLVRACSTDCTVTASAESQAAHASSDSLAGHGSRAPSYLINVLTNTQNWRLRLLAALWGLTMLNFYLWWLQSAHVAGLFGFLLNSLLISWSLGIPAYYLYFLLRMKRVDPRVGIPAQWRVAIVTTRAPSEPFAVVKETLQAMLAQTFPHDTWLADEDPTPEIYEWCAQHGVRVSTRKGIAEYHRNTWPRRTKCKEGNLAYFYDHYGYEQYDFVVQLDADHIPSTGYIEAMLRPFVDDQVGYVSGPSICDKNAASSWSARGRLFLEAGVHGPLQAGYTNGFAPMCFGSHYAVRTTALRDIGGLGPELAEDHSTTLMMNGHGWRGVHALDAIAHGDGPMTFADALTQEFQWSRSIVVVMLTCLPKYWRRLSGRLRFQFLFCQLWYPIFSGSLLLGILLPVIAVITRQPWVRVSYIEFLMHSLPPMLAVTSIQLYVRRLGLLRPSTSRILSWEVALFQLVRWPWILLGSLMGVVVAITKRNLVFRVTPKGGQRPRTLEWKVLTPYAAIVALTFLLTFWLPDAGQAKGYYFFVILAQLSYVAALLCLIWVHRYESLNSN